MAVTIKEVAVAARVSPRTASRALNGEAQVTTVVINDDLAFVTIPGEPFVQHQLNLAAKSPVPNTLMLGVAYCGRGCPFLIYIPTVQAVKEGGYGATQCSYVSADTGDRMVNAAVASIKELVGKRTEDAAK